MKTKGKPKGNARVVMVGACVGGGVVCARGGTGGAKRGTGGVGGGGGWGGGSTVRQAS